MRKSTGPIIVTAALGLGLVLAGSAGAHKGATGEPAERMDAMKSMAADMKVLVGMIEGKLPYGAEEAHQRVVSLHRNVLEGRKMFTERGGHHSRALPTVWEAPERFAAAMEDFVSSVETLHLAATSKAPQATALAVPVREVARQCSSCHEAFRRPE